MKIISGNLLDFPNGINIICHQANIRNTFGAGIAKQIKIRYPSAYIADVNASNNNQAILGGYSYCKISTNKYIFNLYGQDLHTESIAGSATSYDAIYSALNNMKKKVFELYSNSIYGETEGFIPHIGFPYYMGCNLGGGNWELYKKIIEVCIGNSFQYNFVKYDP